MNANVLEIIEKVRADSTGFVSLQDFKYHVSHSIAAHLVLEKPNITLYCFDFPSRQAIFVETPTDIDLTYAPFYYQNQYEHAQRLYTIPFDDLYALTEGVDDMGENLILIYSVGRCGSTLLSQALKKIDGVMSLSEPGIFTDIVKNRALDNSNTTELMQLLRSGIACLRKPQPNQPTHRWALKFRSFDFEIADLIYQVYPKAKLLFLYRHAEDRVLSEVRAFSNLNAKPPKMGPKRQDMWVRLNPLFADYRGKAARGKLTRIEMSALAWLSRMHRYLTLNEQGMPVTAVRYENMVAEPEAIMTSIFKHFELPVAGVAAAVATFARDSQAGSAIARETVRQEKDQETLNFRHRRQIQAILSNHPVVKTADFVLPNTFMS